VTHIFPRTSPAAEGLEPAAVRRLVALFDELEDIHSFVLMRHGHVVAEGSWAPHTADRPHLMFSVSKSFTATAVGLAIDAGLFSLDDLVVDLLAPDAPAEPSANLAAMRVRHLLTMTTGHAMSTIEVIDSAGGDWVRKILALPVEYEPGTHFVYNTGATYLAAAIVQRLTGQRLLDYLRPRVFEPLGITTATWEQDPDGLDVGGFGLAITVEELAAFGQLYLQRGQWEGRQLVPAEWVDAATAKQVPTGPDGWSDWVQGYGFQFWQCRHGAYRADGAFGQYAIVWPEHDIVVAITSGIANLQSVLDAVWAAELTSPTTTAGDVDTSDLRMRTPTGAARSPREASLLDVTHTLDDNPARIGSVTLTRDESGLVLRVGFPEVERALPLGYGVWAPGTSEHEGQPTEVASAAAWSDESTLDIRVVYLGTPFVMIVAIHVVDDGLEVKLGANVSFDPGHGIHTFAARRVLAPING
jgi:CubicO group peptidase (beta-lactamase class C family)